MVLVQSLRVVNSYLTTVENPYSPRVRHRMKLLGQRLRALHPINMTIPQFSRDPRRVRVAWTYHRPFRRRKKLEINNEENIAALSARVQTPDPRKADVGFPKLQA